MISDYVCTRCKGTDFVRLETINVGSDGRAIETTTSAYRCANCQQRIIIEEGNTITPVDSPGPGHNVANRVRSSVSADARGIPYTERKPI